MKFAKPYTYFCATAIIILLFSLFFYKSDKALDINIYDTYYIIAYSHIGKLFSFLYLIAGLIYFLVKKIKLYRPLIKIHIFISIGSFIAFIIGHTYFSFTTLKVNSNFPLFDDLSSENVFYTIIFVLFIFAQLLFLINLVLSLTKFSIKRKKLS